ncbi:mannose-6-phosphate isomerase, class I, partial [Saccharomonospora sp. NPDC046836]
PEFELSRIHWPPHDRGEHHLTTTGPEILLCTAGELLLDSDDGTKIELHTGQSAWLPATNPTIHIRPTGTQTTHLYRATAGTCAD